MAREYQNDLILNFLAERGDCSMQDIADLIESSTRTAERKIAKLMADDYPIETWRGGINKGGARLIAGSVPKIRKAMTRAELSWVAALIAEAHAQGKTARGIDTARLVGLFTPPK